MRNCSVSPYDLNIVERVGDSGVCFNFMQKTCSTKDDKYKCCEKFNSNLVKMVLNSKSECNRSLDRVTVNGLRKGGGIFFDTYRDGAGELRITSLNMERNAVLSAKICVYLKAGSRCNKWEEFSDGLEYALFDPLGHNCCPTCKIGGRGGVPGSPGKPVVVLRPPPPKRPPPPPLEGEKIIVTNKVCNCTCLP
jgi:hypothetical protein